MSDYMPKAWQQVVDHAEYNLNGNCPLQEDEAVLWADARLTAIESALRACLRHMKTAGDPEAVRACEAAEELLGVRR